MKVCWRALIRYGFIFWLLLCITDFLGITTVHTTRYDLDDLYEKPTAVKSLESRDESGTNKTEYPVVKFGWSLLIWNLLTFCFSLLVCGLMQSVGQTLVGTYKKYRNKYSLLQHQQAHSIYTKTVNASSRIPVIVKNPLMRASDTILTNFETLGKKTIEKSCPNLLMKRSGSNLSCLTEFNGRACRTLFRQDLIKHPGISSIDQLEIRYQQLKDELHRHQTTSLKDHAALSRKVENVTKAKREIEKQLTVMQKENRAAKQQLEEMVQEKAALLKKLENATKEFKSNTRSKKFALAKLEEVTTNVEELRQQLEQVTRDKEILEKKLKLLEVEYNKLHDRYIAAQQMSIARNQDDNLPERDENSQKFPNLAVENLHFSNESALQKTASVLASVSQTEVDMKMIQEKIKQLEKNLENLNISGDGLECYKPVEQFESDLSLSVAEITTDSQQRHANGSLTTFSGYSSNNSPRPNIWTQRVAELIGKNRNQFAKIQVLANQMQQKAKVLSGIKQSGDSSAEESSQSDEREPKRLVSSSIAFKNFLKSLNGLETVNKTQSLPHGIFK
ncbi:uncharacterized protein LOC143199712 [Rhynchophorus ferrugineus]|uniref:uncharacterized protein LOC143199712 n=1 Tax=Rhynchophorus ferrugineus TaxID=354439 RepID=UPI003FCD052B